MALPSKGSPFEGISGTNAPARNTKIPNLTERVALAKTRKAALTHGGLLTPAQQKAASDAGKALAAHKTLKRAATQPKARAASLATPPATKATRAKPLPLLPSSAPFRVPLPSAPTPNPSPPPTTGSRGALVTGPRAGMAKAEAKKPKGNLLGAITNAASTGLGTALETAASIPGTLTTPMRLGATSTPAENVKPTTLGKATTDIGQRSARAAAGLANVGVSGAIPHGFSIPSIDLVAPAGAATTKGAITPDELKALEAQGYDLKPRLKTKFTKDAIKNGWNPAELDGISGSALIDKAFTHPAALPLRILANTASGIARLGTLPAGIEGAVRETAAGHGLDVAKALGEGLYSELPVVGKHKATDTAVADPFGFLTQFAGAGKVAGEAGRLGKLDRGLREVETASSGLKVNRGALSRNAYTATGQLASDKLASQVPRLGAKLEGREVDRIVRSVTNKHAPAYVAVQHAYHDALKKVGKGRAEELLAYQQAGGKPKQIADFYRSQGNAANAKFYDKVAERTQTLAPEDQALLDAHSAIAQHTSQSRINSGKFGDTAATFRRYSQLIRSGAHLGDPDAQRILGLRDDYQKRFGKLPDADIAALEGAYSHAVDSFAAKHAASGGVEPAYVAYSKAKPLVASPFSPSVGSKTAFKDVRGRQKAETGATFEGGKYLIDSGSPLVDSVRAQREHLAATLKDEVASAVGQRATAGDVVPPGHVFVSDTNLRAIRKTTSDMEDNPVSSTDYYSEDHSFRQSLHDALSKNTTPTGHRVPKGEKGHFIPIGAHKRILDHTRPPSKSAYDRFLKQYQRVLISYRPSTIVNNTVGSIPLAATAGAITPRPYMRAIEAMRDPTLAPAILRGHGVAGSLAQDSRSKLGAGMDFMRAQSAKGEDFSRLAAYFAKAGPTFKKRAAELNMSADAYQRSLAAGTVDPHQLDTFLDHAEKFVGDVAKPDSVLGAKIGKTVLFHRWLGHIAKLLLFTLPVNHPRRLAILQDLAAYGDQYRQQHGVWPDWYASYLPLFQHVERIGRAGKAQTFTKTFSTQGINPFSSLQQFASPVSTNESISDILAGVAAPPLSIPFNAIANRPPDSKSMGRYVAGQIVRQIPGVSVVKPQGGMASDSIPFIAEKRKTYAGRRRGESLPYDFRPTARAEPGLLGALVRYGLGGVYDVPAQGPIHNIDQGKHIGAAAKAARKH